MYTNLLGRLVLLSFLLCDAWKSSAMAGHNQDMTESSKYYSTPKDNHSPDDDTLRCSCCDDKAYQSRDILPHGILKCGKKKSLSIRDGYCLTIDEKTDTLEAGRCPYNYYTFDSHVELPRNKSELNGIMCDDKIELHRTGTLCGRCQDGYYPLAYSYDMTCVQCPNGKSNWWKFVLAAFLPLTIFCIIILFFKINVVSSRFQGFLFFSQMISMPAIVRILILFGSGYNERFATHLVVRSLIAFYGIWNLDFFRSMEFGICLGTGMLQTLALDLIVGVYPLLLMVVSYVMIELYNRNFKAFVIMWRPFSRLFGLFKANWDLRTSIIDSIVTTLPLANIKFQSVSFDMLNPVKVYHLHDTGNWTFSYRLFYDATVPYFGSRHLPYAITAVVVIVLFTILPMLLLILYPFRCFQKFLNLFPIRWYILHIFVDSFYGNYKDGTQPGTRDCRWFASLFFFSHFCMMFAGAYIENLTFLPMAAMILAVVAILFVAVQPFKENSSHFTTINVCYVLLLALWYLCITGPSAIVLSSRPLLILYFVVGLVIVGIFPLLYISAIILHWTYSQCKFTDLIAKLRAWRNGYDVIP